MYKRLREKGATPSEIFYHLLNAPTTSFLQFVGGYLSYLNVYAYFPMTKIEVFPQQVKVQLGRNRKPAVVVLLRCYLENYPHYSPRCENRPESELGNFLNLFLLQSPLCAPGNPQEGMIQNAYIRNY